MSELKSTLNVKGIAKALGIGMTKTYEIVNQPGFPSFRIGRKILASYQDVMDWQRKQIAINEQEKARICRKESNPETDLED